VVKNGVKKKVLWLYKYAQWNIKIFSAEQGKQGDECVDWQDK